MSDTIDPEKLEEAIRVYGEVDGAEALGVLVSAARAHLATLPRFKEVEVWRVEWAHPAHAMGRRWKPYAAHYLTEAEAVEKAQRCENHPENHACIRITGPHKQRVPA